MSRISIETSQDRALGFLIPIVLYGLILLSIWKGISHLIKGNIQLGLLSFVAGIFFFLMIKLVKKIF